jgi:hypothetical protein
MNLPPLCQKFKYMITPSPILNLTMVSSTAPPVQIPPSGTYRDSQFLGAEARRHSKPRWSSSAAMIAAVTGYSGHRINYSTGNRRFSRTFKSDQRSREIVLTGDHRLREPVSGGRQLFCCVKGWWRGKANRWAKVTGRKATGERRSAQGKKRSNANRG